MLHFYSNWYKCTKGNNVGEKHIGFSNKETSKRGVSDAVKNYMLDLNGPKNPLISNVLRTFAISAFSDVQNVDRQSYF